MKLIDILRESYNNLLFKTYENTWFYILQIYSDYVDIIKYEDSNLSMEQIEWIDFLENAILEEDDIIKQKIQPQINSFIINMAKEKLET